MPRYVESGSGNPLTRFRLYRPACSRAPSVVPVRLFRFVLRAPVGPRYKLQARAVDATANYKAGSVTTNRTQVQIPGLRVESL